MQNYQKQREIAALLKEAQDRAVWVDFPTLLALVTKVYPGQKLSPLDRLRKHKDSITDDYIKQHRYLRAFIGGLGAKEVPAHSSAEPPVSAGPYAFVVWFPENENTKRFHAQRILELMQLKANKG